MIEEQYYIRIGIDKDRVDSIYNGLPIVTSTDLARLMIKNCNFATVQKILDKPKTKEVDGS